MALSYKTWVYFEHNFLWVHCSLVETHKIKLYMHILKNNCKINYIVRVYIIGYGYNFMVSVNYNK